MTGAAVMAASAAIATIKVLLGPVISLATDRTTLVYGFEDELERLSQFATLIQSFLTDAEDKMHSATVQLWLKRIEDEVFKVQNVMDELNYEKLRREVKYRNQLKKQVCSFFSYFSTISLHSKLASKIREINTNLERLNRQANDLGLIVKCQTDPALPAAVRATTSRLTDSIVVPNVVGRAKDESKIVEMLLSPTERVVSVIPITGMGGIGKTTLAKSVYNNPQIDHHFEKNKFWVCVARKIEIMELFKVILVQLTGEEVRVDDRDVIVKKIGDKLHSKKYFLVLDDVWNHEQRLWNDFFTTLEGLNPTKGSWCLVTTRVTSVAEAVSRIVKMNHDPYFLGKLPDDECWSILRKMVLAGEEVAKELEDLKKQILRKCDGLPLAAKLIGGLLLTNGREKWRSILEDSLLNEDQSEINQILAVSFDHLSPPSVKKCFAYCAIFPQDTELDEDELIQHWIAKGFLLPDQKNKGMMEETGSVYCRILLQNSLLEKVEDKWRRTYYKMHDLVHDFANSILNPASSNQDRYLALSSSEGLTENTKMIIPASIHTLFLRLGWCKSADMLSRFKHLHVLRLSGYVFFLPSSIDQLQHLRLLDISSSGIKSLPESLCKLYNLQTLTLKDGAFEKGFPKRLSNLISLRHLNYYHGRDAEFKMPTQMRRLTCLQTLWFFNVSQEKGCGIEELGTLKYLKGSLEIRNLELVKGKEAADQAKLFEKPNLSRLEFRWEKSKDRKSDNYDEDVLEGLQPHQNLQELEIYYFLGNKFPQWFMNLSELVELRIEYCERCSELPTLGQLPSLKRLYLSGLDNIQFIGDEFYSITNEEEEEEGRQRGLGSSTRSRKFFPVLEELHVQYMENLVEWKDVDRLTINEAELDVFPMIREFAISDCPRLTTLPCLSKIMEVRYCPNLASIRTGNGTSLERLILAECNNLREFPEDTFRSSLRELDIRCCAGLISLGVNGQKCPLPCLEKFTIEDCDELISLPCSSKILVVKNCPKLTSIRTGNGTSLEDLTLTGCDNLRELPEGLFGSSLRNVQIKYCPRLISLGVNGQKCPLPCLEKFIIEDCDELITLPCLSKILVVKNCPKLTSIRTGNGTSLEDLTLTGCDNLRELPEGLLGSSLWNVQIKYCPRLIRLGVNGQKCPLPCLEKFTIEDCNESTTIPDKMFGSCTSIALLGCPNLEPFSLNLQETPSLRTFNLVDCPKLMPQRFKGFAYATCLIELRIGPFSLDDSSIDDFDWSGLISAPALRVLGLEGLPHTDSLPCQLQYLTSLTSLALDSFGGIEVLADWIGDLVSLKYLELWDCKKLRSLPSETAMRRLTKFTHLQVYGCPLLRQRYTPKKGIYHLEEEISRDPASSESEEEEIDDNEQAGRDG